MKLTNSIKRAFVRSVMSDVPKVDYDEEAKPIAMKHAKRLMNKEIWEVIEKFPNHFDAHRTGMPDGLNSVFIRLPKNHYYILKSDVKAWAELSKVAEKSIAQDEKIQALENKIRAVVGGCATLKKLREALPEFVKYMPTEQEPLSKNLPALANVVADFKAAGFKFPKSTEVSA